MTDQFLSDLITQARLEIDGQFVTIPLVVAKNDELLRRSLTPMIPGMANARFERKENNDTLEIKVIKQLGTKGNYQQELINMPESKNPTLVLYAELKALINEEISAEELMMREKEIQKAIEDGETDLKALKAAIGRLSKSLPRPASFIPNGF